MTGTTIIANNVSVKLQGITVLNGVSFDVQQNQHLAIVGASGSGKTTLAKALAGHAFAKGNIGILFDKSSSLEPRVQLIEQRYTFKNLSNVKDFYYQQRFNSFDAEDAPTVMQELLQIADKNDHEKIEQWLDELGMQHRKDAPIIQLSSGEHKRFQLIKALIHPSQILILDYPFIGLDVESRKKLHNIINETAASGTTVILITDVHEIPDCITHVLHLEDGELEAFEEKECFNFSSVTHHHNHPHFNIHALPVQPSTNNFSIAVEMKNVSVKYGGKKILNNISWKVDRGDKWLLKGHNGAGKSTLLSLITGDNPQAYANEIYLFDKRRGYGESIWDIKQKIGYVSPELHAFFEKNISCYDAIGSGFFDTVGLYKKLSQEQHQLIQQWLDFLRISHVHQKPLSSISSGGQRLTLLARALVKNPPLLVLDEPCQGLDDEQKEQFVQLIDDLCEQLDKTLIYVSHYEEEIPECVDKVLLLEAGHETIYKLNNKAAIAV